MTARPSGDLVDQLDQIAGLVNDQRPDRRHPVELTSSRLHDHVEQYGRHLTPDEIDRLADAVQVLDALHLRLEAATRRRARAGE